MIEVRIFKAENNMSNRSYYAVTGATFEAEAIYEVIKIKKAKKGTFFDYNAYRGVIAPYVNDKGEELDGLWPARENTGTPCWVVYKRKG